MVQATQEIGRIKALPLLAQRQRVYKKESHKKEAGVERGPASQEKQKRLKKRRKRVES